MSVVKGGGREEARVCTAGGNILQEETSQENSVCSPTIVCALEVGEHTLL